MALPDPSPGSAALVTGASSGLGLALAEALASRGHNVVLVARRTELLDKLAGDLTARDGVRAEVISCDLADPEARESLFSEVERTGLEIEILVNNAGLGSTGRFQNADVGRQETIVRVNVEAVVALTGHFIAPMVARRRGGVLNVASTTGFQPLSRNATYAASKAFLLSFTEALHTDLAGTGVAATALCPGPVKTELWEGSGEKAADVAGRLPSFVWTTAEMVARQGLDGLAANKRVVVPGALNRLGALGGQHAPRSVLLRVAAAFAGEEEGA